MEITRILSDKKESIIAEWKTLIIDSYPSEATQFLSGKIDQFQNPVGATISKGILELFNYIAFGENLSNISGTLNQIIRIRSVQDFTPSEAVRFIFDFKEIIRVSLAEFYRSDLISELLVLESRIDKLALLAFNQYSECKEQLLKIKTDEIKRTHFKLLERIQILDKSEQNINNHESKL